MDGINRSLDYSSSSNHTPYLVEVHWVFRIPLLEDRLPAVSFLPKWNQTRSIINSTKFLQSTDGFRRTSACTFSSFQKIQHRHEIRRLPKYGKSSPAEEIVRLIERRENCPRPLPVLVASVRFYGALYMFWLSLSPLQYWD